MATIMTATLHGSQARTTSTGVTSPLAVNSNTPSNGNSMGKHGPGSMIPPKDSIDLNGTRYIFRTHSLYDNLHYYNALLDTHSSGVPAGANAAAAVADGHIVRPSYSTFLGIGPGAKSKEGPQFSTTLISSTSGASSRPNLSQGVKKMSSQQQQQQSTMKTANVDKSNANSVAYYFDRNQRDHHLTLKQRFEQLTQLEYQSLHRLLHQHFRGERRIGSVDGDGETEEGNDYNAEDPATWPSNWLAQVSTMILEPDNYLSRRPALNTYQRQLIRRISAKYEHLVEHYLGQIEADHAYEQQQQQQQCSWSSVGSRRDVEMMPVPMARRTTPLSNPLGKSSSFTTTPTDARAKGRLNPIREEPTAMPGERYQSLQDCLNQQHYLLDGVTRTSTSSGRTYQQQQQQQQQQHTESPSTSTGKLNKWSSKMMKIYLKKNGH